MQIEFRKIPTIKKEFNITLNSVNFLGNFSRISNRLAKIDSKIVGNYDVQCCKCGKNIDYKLDEKQVFILSDGIFSSNDEKEDEIVIEIDNHIVDFNEILNSELESINSDYYICEDCKTNDKFVEIEF